jgi:hypothetical protein
LALIIPRTMSVSVTHHLIHPTPIRKS